MPLGNPSRKFDDLVYQDIMKSRLHFVAAKEPVLPCSEVIS